MMMRLAFVEVVMMDPVRGAIRASGGIWVGRKTVDKKLWNSRKKIGPVERLGRPVAGMYIGNCLTKEYFMAKVHFTFEETIIHALHIAFDDIACWMTSSGCVHLTIVQRAISRWGRNTALKKHMKIVREAIFHPCPTNNLSTCSPQHSPILKFHWLSVCLSSGSVSNGL